MHTDKKHASAEKRKKSGSSGFIGSLSNLGAFGDKVIVLIQDHQKKLNRSKKLDSKDNSINYKRGSTSEPYKQNFN